MTTPLLAARRAAIFIVLVCGGRKYDHKDVVFATLDRVYAKHPEMVVLTGGCQTGADDHAAAWAWEREVPFITHPARWKFEEARGQRNRAGPIRNSMMEVTWAPNAVIAFPGGTGTADMVLKAETAGIPVMRVP